MFQALTAAGLTVFAIILIAIICLVLGGLFWGWVAMLIWPLFATPIGFAKAFWVGIVVTLVLGVLSN
jgi:hypothetical protein